MLRFILASAVYWARSVLVILIVLLTVVLAGIIVGVPHSSWHAMCRTVLPPVAARNPIPPDIGGIYPCEIPSRASWQIPVAILVGVAGLGAASAVAFWRRGPKPVRPLPPLPNAWR